MNTAAAPVAQPLRRTDASSWRFLYRLNPLAMLVAVLPVIVAVLFTRTVSTPLAITLLGAVILLIGVRLSARGVLLLLVGLPLFVVVLAFSFGLWTDPASVANGSAVGSAVGGTVGGNAVLLGFGGFHLTVGAARSGLATALRLAALIVLALVASLGADGPELVRSAVRYLRVPYRIGYAVLAAYRFVPRFAQELDLIRQAHRVRGQVGRRGPLGAIRRGFGYTVPLLAAAIRHAERVAMAMDARAFGAYPTRTERHLVSLRMRDGVAVTVFWLAAALSFILTAGLR